MSLCEANQQTGKVLIAGTGRAGTTLLMRIFIRLGLPTGFTLDDVVGVEKLTGRAGLEQYVMNLEFGNMPEIVKSPYICDVLEAALIQQRVTVDQIIIPIRDLDQATNSRIRVSDIESKNGVAPLHAAGGMWETTDPEHQKNVLAHKLYTLVNTAVSFQIPMIFVSFPKFAQDLDYFVKKIGPFLQERYEIAEKTLRQAHAQEVKLEFIGDHV